MSETETEDFEQIDEDAEGSESRPDSPDPEQIARSEAALAQVLKFGDPVLRSSASPVDDFGPGLAAEIERMIQITFDAPGSGLAAPQIGILRRVLVYRPDRRDEILPLVNPEIEWLSEETEVDLEGCLSIPDVALEVERSLSVRMKARDASGEEVILEETGWNARVLQHEFDHLDGVLTLDRAPKDQRKGALRALRRGESYWPPGLEADDDGESED